MSLVPGLTLELQGQKFMHSHSYIVIYSKTAIQINTSNWWCQSFHERASIHRPCTQQLHSSTWEKGNSSLCKLIFKVNRKELKPIAVWEEGNQSKKPMACFEKWSKEWLFHSVHIFDTGSLLHFVVIFRTSQSFSLSEKLETHCRRSQLEALDSDPHCVPHLGPTGGHGQLRSSGSSWEKSKIQCWAGVVR